MIEGPINFQSVYELDNLTLSVQDGRTDVEMEGSVWMAPGPMKHRGRERKSHVLELDEKWILDLFAPSDTGW